MKKTFSETWKASKQKRKQVKYRANAPAHTKSKFLASSLSKDLKKSHNKRSITVKKGDKIKVLRGQFKNKEGKVEKVNVNREKIYITGIEFVKKDGTKTQYPLHPSNLQITSLNTDDKKRIKVNKK